MQTKDREDPQPDHGKGPPEGKGRPVDHGRPVPTHPSAGPLLPQRKQFRKK